MFAEGVWRLGTEELMEEVESQDSDVSDVPDLEVLDSDSHGPDSDVDAHLDGDDLESDSESDSESDGWDAEGSEGAGWFADPDVEGQERYYDGSEWTSETRSAEPDAPKSHLPDHAGELQRALAAATGDIDDVEDRLGSLFDRAEQQGQRGGRARKQAEEEAAARAAQGRALADSVAQDGADEDDEEWLVDDDDEGESGLATGGAGDDDDDALPDLDEDLAHEEPEKVKKGLFRRRP